MPSEKRRRADKATVRMRWHALIAEVEQALRPQRAGELMLVARRP